VDIHESRIPDILLRHSLIDAFAKEGLRADSYVYESLRSFDESVERLRARFENGEISKKQLKRYVERAHDELYLETKMDHEQLNEIRAKDIKPLRLGYEPMISAVIRLGIITEDRLQLLLSSETGYPMVSLHYSTVNPRVVGCLSRWDTVPLLAFPYSRNGATISVAMADPSDEHAVDLIEQKIRSSQEEYVRVEIAVASLSRIQWASEKFYHHEKFLSQIERFVRVLQRVVENKSAGEIHLK
jgi:hypothetical protein